MRRITRMIRRQLDRVWAQITGDVRGLYRDDPMVRAYQAAIKRLTGADSHIDCRLATARDPVIVIRIEQPRDGLSARERQIISQEVTALVARENPDYANRAVVAWSASAPTTGAPGT